MPPKCCNKTMDVDCGDDGDISVDFFCCSECDCTIDFDGIVCQEGEYKQAACLERKNDENEQTRNCLHENANEDYAVGH